MKILIIDNNIDQDYWGAADLRRLTASFSRHGTVVVRRAPQEDLPSSPSSFDRIIVSGSKTSCLEDAPWISKLLDFIKQTVDKNKPYLGVCYGHQTLVRALGGKELLKKSENPELGWTKIQIREPSLLFNGMVNGIGKTFYSFSSHNEEVSQLPPGLRHLAQSELCQIQACQLGDQPIFGIQFHPEKPLADAKKTLLKAKQDAKKNRALLSSLLHPDRSDELYDSKIGEIIFKNFLEMGHS
jgi:GMP synthase (glutamine-hydrolysing)